MEMLATWVASIFILLIHMKFLHGVIFFLAFPQ
jgi:hypothetical protein